MCPARQPVAVCNRVGLRVQASQVGMHCFYVFSHTANAVCSASPTGTRLFAVLVKDVHAHAAQRSGRDGASISSGRISCCNSRLVCAEAVHYCCGRGFCALVSPRSSYVSLSCSCCPLLHLRVAALAHGPAAGQQRTLMLATAIVALICNLSVVSAAIGWAAGHGAIDVWSSRAAGWGSCNMNTCSLLWKTGVFNEQQLLL